MSLKQEIETWVDALAKYDSNEFEEALKTFDSISDTSKILFNCGVIHATLGEHDKAVECYQRAVQLDRYLAVAYFQQGVSNFLVGDFEEALANFNDTLLYLRGNTYIDYDQLGLKFKLYSCEVLFNRGLCYIYLQQKITGLEDLAYASKEKITPDHDVIDEAIREEADGYTVFSIPVGVVYRPNSAKVKNLKTKDYLGKARLIASADRANMGTGFAGAEKRINITIDSSKEDRPPDSLSYAASNLVRQDLTSRPHHQRQTSAPPINRNMFPPTPPPESEQPPRNGSLPSRNAAAAATASQSHNMSTRASSVRQGSNAVPRLPALRTHFDRRPETAAVSPKSCIPAPNQNSNPWNLNSETSASRSAGPERQRLGTLRTASEPRYGASKYSKARSDRSSRERENSNQGRLFGEAPSRSRMDHPSEADEYPDELYELYRNTASANPYGPSPASEKNPYGPSPASERSARFGSDGGLASRGSGSLSGSGGASLPLRRLTEDSALSRDSHGTLDDFEILNGPPLNNTLRSRGSASSHSSSSRPHAHGYGYSQSGPGASSSHTLVGYGGSNGVSPVSNASNGEPRTLRVKMRYGEDARYMMVSTTVTYEEFVARVREKLELPRVGPRVKVMIRDEGDLITIGDRDDWEMALAQARKDARRASEEMARLDVWIRVG